MNRFAVDQFVARCIELEAYEVLLRARERCFMGRRAVSSQMLNVYLSTLNELAELALVWNFLQVSLSVSLLFDYLKRSPTISIVKMEAEIRRVRETIQTEIAKKQFLLIAQDRTKYLDGRGLFGPDVDISFPSAIVDIQQAGNCLAVECTTAAVFHTMRAVEIALRALAIDRKPTFAKGSLDVQQWGNILAALEVSIKALRTADRKLWPSAEIKEAQVSFYNEAYLEFRSINEAWRKHVSHAHKESLYDRDQAISIFSHSCRFMQVLARRISEASVTPEYWIVI
jgi:hypothetical protein